MSEEARKAFAEAMVPILEQESNLVWGPQSVDRILRWTSSACRMEIAPAGTTKRAEIACAVVDSATGWIRRDEPEPPTDRFLLVAVLERYARVSSVHIGMWDGERGWRSKGGRAFNGQIVGWKNVPPPPVIPTSGQVT